MGTQYNYRIFCETDSRFEYTVAMSAPATCPANDAHTITASRTANLGRAGCGPQWKKFVVSHSELQAAALTNDVELFKLKANEQIHAVKVKHSEPFAGAGIKACTVSVGVASSLAKYHSAFDVHQTVGPTAQSLEGKPNTESQTADASIRLQATSTGADLDASTAGAVEVWVLVSEAP